MLGAQRFPVDLPLLVAADVGSAGGLSEHWKPFLSSMEVDAFEPDAEECQRQAVVAPANVHWHPIGLARDSGPHKLYVLNRSTGSSLYPPNEPMMSRFSTDSYCGLKKTVEIDCSSLSDFLHKQQRPAPHLLKLDTQGSELDILSGLSDSSWPTVLGVETEVEFLELYKGQPLFCDVNAFMTAKGFELLDLRTHRAYRCRKGVEGYLLRNWNFDGASDQISAQLVAGDALYLRRLEDVLVSRETLLRYFLVTLIYHYYELASEALDEGRSRNLLGAVETESLHRFMLELGPRPTLLQRRDLIGALGRRVQTRLGRSSGYRTFWTTRWLPDQ